jgi:hypothetical protein
MKDLTPIASSNLDGAKYDATSKTLTLKFKSGGVYEYAGVPSDVYESFAATFQTKDSSGRHFQKHIKSFPCTKVSK